jgi:endonuclease YncB( thermonuclease family)
MLTGKTYRIKEKRCGNRDERGLGGEFEFPLARTPTLAYAHLMNRLAVLLIVLARPPGNTTDFRAKVVGISDGDTLTVLKADETQAEIRLHGIDAPEVGQDFATRSKQATSELAFGRTVTVRPMSIDRYGRTVAEVVLPDGRSLNRELVRAGIAWWFRSYAPNDRELERLEAEAREARRGLWSQPNPIPPWEWRAGKAQPVTAGVIGNRRSHLYHNPSWRGVATMKPKNRVEFATAEQAEAAGYRKAGDCR